MSVVRNDGSVYWLKETLCLHVSEPAAVPGMFDDSYSILRSFQRERTYIYKTAVDGTITDS